MSNAKDSCSQTNAGQTLFSAETCTMAPQSTSSCSQPGYIGGTAIKTRAEADLGEANVLFTIDTGATRSHFGKSLQFYP